MLFRLMSHNHQYGKEIKACLPESIPISGRRWLKANGYDRAMCVLPHDGANAEKVFATTYQGALSQAGFPTMVMKNQGRGAAMARVEAVRRVMGSVWFDEKRTEVGRDCT